MLSSASTSSTQVVVCNCASQTAYYYLVIAGIYISISTGTFDIENIKYEKKWQQLDLDTYFKNTDPGKIVLVAIIVISGKVILKKHNVATVQGCIMILFRTILLNFFDGKLQSRCQNDDGVFISMF